MVVFDVTRELRLIETEMQCIPFEKKGEFEVVTVHSCGIKLMEMWD